ncbi:MAG: AMP-binding protein [Gammaproteobacteria bacterium]|nr:AMP-binding protein [Gammaproteobacteria bacterium]
MNKKTLGEYVQSHAETHPDRTWLRERHGDDMTEWTWRECQEQINAAGAWIEDRFGPATNIALLSKNRPHWFMADLAIIGAGCVTVPLFTTLSKAHSEYILEFAEVRALVLGETTNWDGVSDVLPDGVEIITLPGVDCQLPHHKWNDIVTGYAGRSPDYRGDYDDMISIAFTSGTTGVPKGAIQTHRSFVEPAKRIQHKAQMPDGCRAFSYLPLAHIAERNVVEAYSVVFASEVTFNESLEFLVRDLHEARPHYLFGAPRVWEQIQQGVIAGFGSRENYEAALNADHDNVAAAIREKLGLQDAQYLITGAAPAPPSMLDWYWDIGLYLTEGYGQTEAMGICGATAEDNRRGSIGKIAEGVEARITKDGELVLKADGLSPGYYKRPEKTAELWQDGWLHTGDKASIDEDGFVFLSGRVKEYFKTIHGKFVSPAPIESDFAACPAVEQLCLLGRGYSKTVMVCVLSDAAADEDRTEVEKSLLQHVAAVNETVYHHARIGAVVVTAEPWTIDNGVLTPTLKIRRGQVEDRFGELAEALGRQAAESHQEIVHWL